MNSPKGRIGIFGGTFDPVHHGHLIMAEQVQSHFSLDRVIFMPAGSPPHKIEGKISDNKSRIQMLKLALQDNPFFRISTWEIEKQDYSYSVKTLREFVPVLKAEEVFFIIGADSLANIFNWKEPEYLLKNGKFIAVNRPGYDLDKIMGKEQFSPFLDNIYAFFGPYIDISSSLIRDEFKNGFSIRYLTPDPVIRFIEKNNLYN
ncbi:MULTISPECIES: nicotinate-nucleotide adenylyltransferase [unclassified Halanaerobium]|uniref:nicotinate-nucleotide adenylyltransferase n=1 Tax=unclassified Halanaerobium TaxID=2641197 RepID=UPI000DF18A88|nr:MULTISPECIES: nicotinate-nucleotide adenylyltransferase [unclassified Halanaerobium]RCW49775.1 nicotinate-nucleotide adenylyltransferase [Halanaerobium sp. MA284_MarDTE_T2]RCW88453.1 nicotinate-nucleotide adenylyltransferase [Halanaerobium sp. DL-01]